MYSDPANQSPPPADPASPAEADAVAADSASSSPAPAAVSSQEPSPVPSPSTDKPVVISSAWNAATGRFEEAITPATSRGKPLSLNFQPPDPADSLPDAQCPSPDASSSPDDDDSDEYEDDEELDEDGEPEDDEDLDESESDEDDSDEADDEDSTESRFITTGKRCQPEGCDLPEDSALLARVAAGDTSPIDLAAELGIRLELLLDWMSAPDTRRRLNTLLDAHDLMEDHQHKADAAAVAASLREAHERARKAEDFIEQRRTGVALLRFYARPSGRRCRFGDRMGTAGAAPSPTRVAVNKTGALTLTRFPEQFRTRARTVRAVPVLHEPPVILPPPTQPTAASTPAQTTIHILHRLQDSDNPNLGDGLRTLFNHFTAQWRQRIGVATAQDFACTHYDAYHKLLAHHSAVLHPTAFAPPSYQGGPILRAVQQADFIDIDGVRWLLQLEFRRTSGTFPWLIDGLAVTHPPPPPDSPNSS